MTLARYTSLSRARTPMKRSRIRRCSPKQAKRLAAWATVTLARMVRVGNKCERCHVAQPRHGHHVLPRAQGGKDTDANCRVVCEFCHEEIHNFPTHSYKTGWLLRRNEA